jgi:hypothetical protein
LVHDPFVQMAANDGWAVCGVDARGIGEVAINRILTFERMKWVAAASLLMNQNFVWRQGWDFRCALQYLQTRLGISAPMVLYGRGDNSSLAVTYALTQKINGQTSQPRAYILRDGFLSFRQFADRPKSMALSYRLRPDMREPFSSFDHEIPPQYFPFDALRCLDLPQLLASVESRGLVVNPIDGDWEPMSEPAARKFLPPSIGLTCTALPEQIMLQFLCG